LQPGVQKKKMQRKKRKRFAKQISKKKGYSGEQKGELKNGTKRAREKN